MAESISVGKVMAMRDKLLVQALPLYLGAFLAGDIFLQFSMDVCSVLGDSCRRDAVINSLRSLAGVEFNQARMEEVAWRLAGNVHRLRAGLPVEPWREQTDKEWVPVEIVRVIKEFRVYKASTPEQYARADAKGKVHRRGAAVRLLFLGGLPAGRTEDKFWSLDYCQTIRQALGFDRFNKTSNARHFSRRTKYLFLDIREIYGRRFYVHLDPGLSRHGELAFGEVKSNSAMLKANRELHKLRMRVEHACPMSYADSFDCFGCHVGRDQCPAACHAATFTVAHCPACHKDGYFDPDYSEEVCVDC